MSTESTSLYRRHRPGSFDEVVGQTHVVRTLRNAVEQDKVNHAYLFVGSRGTGKTSMAKILARSLNCERGGPTVTPCGECESCVTIAAGTSMDVMEMDAASNRSVEDIRDLRERVAYAPSGGRWKVYILDEAHMLTKEAWNAFLKTLEEPPPNTVFVLATTESHKVMPTIADRCQRFDFQRPSLEQISEVLNRVAVSESIEVDAGAVAMIARSAQGSFRDALGTLDQLVAFGGNQVGLDEVLEMLGAADADLLFEAVDAVAVSDPKAVLLGVEKMARSGRDPSQYARDLLAHLRLLLVTQTTGEVPTTFVVTATDTARIQQQAGAVGAASLVRTIDELATALSAVREGDDARMAVEIALLKAARPDLDPSTEGLLRRIEKLEAQLAGGAHPPTPIAPPPSPPARPSEPTPSTPHPARPEPQASAPESPAPEPQPQASGPTAAQPAAAQPQTPEPSPAQPAAAQPATPEPSPAQPPAAQPDAPEPTPAQPQSVQPDAAEPSSPQADAPSAGDAVGGTPPEEASATGRGSGSPAAAGLAAGAPPSTESPGAPTVALEHLDQVTRIWPSVLDKLAEKAPALAATFEGARPVAFDDEGLTIGFPPDQPFNKRKAESPDRRDALIEAFKAVTGEGVAPRYVLLEEAEAAAAEAAAPPPDAPAPGGEEIDEDELLQRLKSEFDAEEVS
ncbi:MAG TPA: DNA polymerase III subunit gamma/tau [Solirubrobacterales bacterium]|nr:DNA polymerase III subunit gamma/tau [Solirubrobacterales bacterium]